MAKENVKTFFFWYFYVSLENLGFPLGQIYHIFFKTISLKDARGTLFYIFLFKGDIYVLQTAFLWNTWQS